MNLNIVLVRTIYPRNIGMCSRAIANMGGGRLILISPVGAFADEEARQGAAGAQEALQNAVVYSSWDEFYRNQGEGWRVAFSARDGRLRPAEQFSERLEVLKSQTSPFLFRSDVPVYFVFGPEDDGLTAEDMRLAHNICKLPTFGEFTSYNLSHAVLMAMYIWNEVVLKLRPRVELSAGDIGSDSTSDLQSNGYNKEPSRSEAIRRRRPVYFPETTIETWLETLGFDLSARRVNAAKVIKRILLENAPSHDELRVLESVLQQNIRKLQEKDISL